MSFKSLGQIILLGALTLLSLAGAIRPASAQDDSIRNIQEMLIWIGDYDGLISGLLTSRTERAIKKFQTRISDANPNGILTESDRSKLQSLGSQARGKTGFRVFDDPITGIRIGVPFNLVAPAVKKSDVDGTVHAIWKSADGRPIIEALQFSDGRKLDTIYQTLKKQDGSPPVYDRPPSDGWFSFSRKDKNGNDYYVRVLQRGPSARGFSITYSGNEYKPLVAAMVASFDPFPSKDTVTTLLKPKDKDVCFNSGGAFSFNEVIAACNRLPRNLLSFIHQNLGVVNQQLDLFDDAIDEYKESLKSDNGYTAAYVGQSFCYLYLKEWNLAISNASTAIRQYATRPPGEEKPQRAAAYANRAYAYAQLGNLSAALDDLNAAIDLVPDFDRALNYRGMVLRSQGLLDLALDDLKQAIGRSPRYAAAYANRGMVYQAKGDLPDARSDYEAALGAYWMTPDREWALNEAIKRLAAIGAAPKPPTSQIVTPPVPTSLVVTPPVPDSPVPPTEQPSFLERMRLAMKQGILDGIDGMRRVLSGQSGEAAPGGAR